MTKKKQKKARKPSSTSSLPVVIPNEKPVRPDGIPVDYYSYSMMALFASNPVMFRIKYVNRDTIETTRSSTSVLGNAVHAGLKAFLGGDENFPVMHTDTDADRLKYALEAALTYTNGVPDGFIDWKKNVPHRGALNEMALLAIPRYVREWDRGHIKETLLVEGKIQTPVAVQVANKRIELPVPLQGYIDHAYEDTAGNICIDDHKTVFRYSDPDAIDGAKLLQAGSYYFLVYAQTGRAPHKMTFREYKISENSDKSSQTREYEIIYGELPMVFDLFFRFYADMTRALLGEQVYVPNVHAMFDRDVALLAYVYRLDEPNELEKQRKRLRVDDVAALMQKKLSRSRNLKRFMEAKASLFTSALSLNYETMQSYDRIRMKLMEHGMPLTFVDKIEGLSVELYRFDPSVGIKMTTLEKYQKDVEQVLGSSGVRILAPIPGTSYIGFEVPKKNRTFPSMPKKKPAGLHAIQLGVDIYGETYFVDVPQMPHMLIGGTTGSGKSVLLHSFIEQLVRLPKTEVQLALMDPKMVELADFQDDAHVYAYADDPMEIYRHLGELHEQMEARYAMFKKAKVKSLEQYREKVDNTLPYIVCIIDEFGDLILKGEIAKGIKEKIILLAQKARAAGIHLVITTQRPSAKIVDGLIKANFPTRVALKTVSKVDSEIILDRTGAEILQGKGDMLVMHGGSAAVRIQGFNV